MKCIKPNDRLTVIQHAVFTTTDAKLPRKLTNGTDFDTHTVDIAGAVLRTSSNSGTAVSWRSACRRGRRQIQQRHLPILNYGKWRPGPLSRRGPT